MCARGQFPAHRLMFQICSHLIILNLYILSFNASQNSSKEEKWFLIKPCVHIRYAVIKYILQTSLLHVGFEVLTAVNMKSIIFWDITPCSPLGVNRRFGGTYRLVLQGKKVS
jgi:hypothetical protein